MKQRKRVSVLLSLFLSGPAGFLCAPDANALPQQPQKATPNKLLDKPSKHSGPAAKAEFGRPSTEAAPDQIRRRSRESRRKNFFPLVTDPGTLVDGQQETTALRIEDYVSVEPSDPGYPASVSAAVIIGTVIGAKGFVSEDRTYVYSDYQIRVDEILKQDSRAKLTVGAQLIASRTGAAVHFLSGHVSHYLTMGRGLPKIGKQYLLFLLRSDPDLSEYDICYGAAYELSGGRAYPLDDDHHYREPEYGDASRLVTKVKNAIAVSPK